MKALILAAGKSKRMKPIEDKNFLLFLGKPLIYHQVKAVIDAGFKEVIVVGGAHNLERLIEALSAFTFGNDVDFKFTEQKNLEEGMSGAVLSAHRYLNDSPLLVFSGNDVVDQSAFELVKEAFKKDESKSCLLAKKVDKYFPGGYLKINEEGLISDIIEKPKEGSEPSNLVNLVVHLHRDGNELCDFLRKAKSEKDDLYEVALSKMMKSGKRFEAIEYSGFWQAIKYPWHVQKVFTFLFEKKNSGKKVYGKNVKIARSSVLNGAVILGDNVRIMENVVINGPTYIGDNSVVATGALVRESCLGPNCVIGFNTEIARSYLGEKIFTHMNYIGDSVIGNDVSFGAGSITGNLRLDEKNIQIEFEGARIDTGEGKFGLVTGDHVRIGANCTFAPGVRVGGNSYISGGVLVPHDVPEKSFVKAKIELEVRENREG